MISSAAGARLAAKPIGRGARGLEALAGARPQMIATLDSFRDMLKDLGGTLGVTDPVSGPAVLDVTA